MCIKMELVIDLSKINRWQRHGDLVLVDNKLLNKIGLSEEVLDEKTIDKLCDLLNCKRLAVKSKINDDDHRTPQVKLLKGTDPMVMHVDNDIKYSFDVTKCMFSFGNIKEKLRVSKLRCTDEVVVDLFAGIGYFTLPFLVHCRARMVHSCEWNPDAVEALRTNLRLNKVEDRCTVHFGDNRTNCPVGVADRVYMGLIPTSVLSLETACRALKLAGGVIHFHENVNTFGSNKQEKGKILLIWAEEISQKVKLQMERIYSNKRWQVQILEINKVKAYAPHVDHCVVDIDVSLMM